MDQIQYEFQKRIQQIINAADTVRSTLTSLFSIDFRKSLDECCADFYGNRSNRNFYYMVMVNNTVGFCSGDGTLLKAVSFDKQYYSLNCQKANLKLFG